MADLSGLGRPSGRYILSSLMLKDSAANPKPAKMRKTHIWIPKDDQKPYHRFIFKVRPATHLLFIDEHRLIHQYRTRPILELFKVIKSPPKLNTPAMPDSEPAQDTSRKRSRSTEIEEPETPDAKVWRQKFEKIEVSGENVDLVRGRRLTTCSALWPSFRNIE
jgi:hypothetical protein